MRVALPEAGTNLVNRPWRVAGTAKLSGAVLGTGTLTFGNADSTTFSGNVTCTGFGGGTIN
ncbi:MAG: hypothetical protein P8X49_07930, partial [Syntrophobacterales bacterium]